jgi:hypothetical protein
MLLLTLHSHYAEGYFPLVDEPIEPYNFVTRSSTIRSPNATAKPRIPGAVRNVVGIDDGIVSGW